MTTFDRIIAHLADKSKFLYLTVRSPFMCANGVEISIQKSGMHRSDSGSVELDYVPHSPIIAQYGREGDSVYNFVPLEVLEKYIDWLESLSADEVKSLTGVET